MQASQCFLLGMLLASSPASYFYYDWKGFSQVIILANRSLWHRWQRGSGSGGLQTWLGFSEVLGQHSSQQSLQPDPACLRMLAPVSSARCPMSPTTCPKSHRPHSPVILSLPMVDNSDLPSSPRSVIIS